MTACFERSDPRALPSLPPFCGAHTRARCCSHDHLALSARAPRRPAGDSRFARWRPWRSHRSSGSCRGRRTCCRRPAHWQQRACSSQVSAGAGAHAQRCARRPPPGAMPHASPLEARPPRCNSQAQATPRWRRPAGRATTWASSPIPRCRSGAACWASPAPLTARCAVQQVAWPLCMARSALTAGPRHLAPLPWGVSACSSRSQVALRSAKNTKALWDVKLDLKSPGTLLLRSPEGAVFYLAYESLQQIGARAAPGSCADGWGAAGWHVLPCHSLCERALASTSRLGVVTLWTQLVPHPASGRLGKRLARPCATAGGSAGAEAAVGGSVCVRCPVLRQGQVAPGAVGEENWRRELCVRAGRAPPGPGSP